MLVLLYFADQRVVQNKKIFGRYNFSKKDTSLKKCINRVRCTSQAKQKTYFTVKVIVQSTSVRSLYRFRIL